MSVYKEADGLKYIMELRSRKRLKNQFPSIQKDWIRKFTDIELYLNENHHKYVNLGAAASGSGILTDHGVDHVQMVMNKAWEILCEDRQTTLTGYEIFLLLIAIHFHDLGNIYGRDEHEKKICDVMAEMGERLPLDTVEQTYVTQIAMAHGGYADALKLDKDTVRDLASSQPCNGVLIRPALLATILRFADELSDDCSRALNLSIPLENEIYHAYSKSLEPLYFKGETISFHYRVPYEQTQIKLHKGTEEVYLYDEIRSRLTKCMQELEYCRKFADGFIRITTINVTIDIMKKDKPFAVAATDSFRLRLLGYPQSGQYTLDNFIEKSVADEFTSADNAAPKYSTGEELKRAMDGEV